MHDVHLDSDLHALLIKLPLGEGQAPDRVVIDDTRFLFTAHFKKAGPDLILTDDNGKKLVLVGYFSLEKRPDLVSSHGAVMSADLVGKLAGPEAPGRYTQAGAPAGAEVIGRVEILGSIATVQHANGVVENLKAGDALLKGDVVMTGGGSSLTLSLIDGTALNMGADARMVLSELNYDSNSTSNSGVINLVKGGFTFVAGQVAHTGGMRVTTPVATMGIRGTTVGAYLDADVTGNVYQFTATLLNDPNGGNGRYDVTDPTTGAVLYSVEDPATQVTFTSEANNQIRVQEAPKSAAIVQQELAVVQVLFPIFLANPANAQSGQIVPQPRNDSLTPPQDQPQPPPPQDPTLPLQVFITKTVDKDTPTTNATTIQPFRVDLVQTPATPATPTASIAIAPIDGNNIINLHQAQSGFVVNGGESGADGQIVTVTILDSRGNIVGSYATPAAGGSWSVTVPAGNAAALADGIYTVKAAVSDVFGSPAQVAMQTITIDKTPPTLGIAAITGDNLINSSKAHAGFAINGSEVGADGQPVTVTILDSNEKVVGTFMTLAGAGSWSLNVSPALATALADGIYTIKATVSDAAGNSSAPATQAITVHEAGPTIAVGVIASDNIINRSQAQAGFVISGNETGADGQPVTVTIINNNGHAVESFMTATADGTWSVKVSSADAIALADGNYTVAATVSDSFGNAATATQTFNVDETPPTLGIAAITGDNVVNRSEAEAGFAIAGTETGADGRLVTVQILNSSNQVVDSHSTTGAGGVWSVSISGAEATALADGSYRVIASVSDAAGNPATATQTFSVDETLPTLNIAEITGDSVVNRSEAQAGFAITGTETGADGQPVTVQILNLSNQVVDSHSTTAAGGVWSVSISAAEATALTDGTYLAVARIADAAGNLATAVQTFNVDETPPNVAITGINPDTGSSSSDGITNAAVVLVSGSAEANSTVEVFDNGTPVGTITANTAGQWSLPNVTLSTGISDLTATATDTAGNSSAAPATFMARLDTGEQVTVSLNGLTGGNALEDQTITATVGAANNDVPNSGVNYTWSVSHDGGNTWSTVGGNSRTYTPSESDEGGLLRVVASFTDVAGNAESGSAVVGVLPLLTIADDTLSVAPNGSVPLGINVIQEPTPDDTISVTISLSAGAHAPTISAADGATGHPVTSGGITTYTFALVDVSSGLNFTNHGDQTDVVTVAEILNGDTGSSQAITVTDPPISGPVIAENSLNALTISSGTFELNNDSLQTSLISIALAAAFLVDGSAALSMPIENNGQFILQNNAAVDITGALSGLGSFTINTGATLQFGTGLHTISGATTDNGKLEVTNGTLEIAGAISGTGSLQIDSGAALQLDTADSLNVAFTGSTGELILNNPGNFTGMISGLTGNDQVDLANINWQAATVTSSSYSATTNVTTLVITDGQHTDTILLVGDYRSSTWTFSSDGSGGTTVIDPVKTAVALDVRESAVVADPSALSSDAVASSSSIGTHATAIANTSEVSSAGTGELTSIGINLSVDHFQFENAHLESNVTTRVAATDSDGLHATSQWLADFLPSVADGHFPTPQLADWAVKLHTSERVSAVDVAVAHAQLDHSHFSNDDRGVELPAQPALHIPSIIPTANPGAHTTLPSLPLPALNAPPFDDDELPAAHLPLPEADPQFVRSAGQVAAHAIGAAAQDVKHSVSSYMAPLPMDQFQFADLITTEPHETPHLPDLISSSAASQLLIEATNPAHHIASENEIPTPGPELIVLHFHQTALHGSGGFI